MRFNGTDDECAALIAAVDADLGYPRGYTQADIDSGLIVRHGGGRHVPLENIRTETASRALAPDVDDDGNPTSNRRTVRMKRLTGDVRKRIGHARVLRVINRGSAEQLERLPGIGAGRAASIIAYRDANGRLRNIAALSDAGIPAAAIRSVRDEADSRTADEDDSDAPAIRAARKAQALTRKQRR